MQRGEARSLLRRDDVRFGLASGRTYRRNEQTQTVSRVVAPPEVAAAHRLPEGAEVYARARLVKEGDHWAP